MVNVRHADTAEALPARCAALPLVLPHALTVGVRGSTPPYFRPPATAPTGLEPALIAELAKRLGVPLIRWAEVPRKPARPTVDLVVHATRRALDETGFFPYVGLQDALLARAGTSAASARTVSSLAKLRVGVIDAEGRASAKRLGLTRRLTAFESVAAGVAALRHRAVDVLLAEPNLAKQVADASAGEIEFAALFPPRLYYGIEVGSNPKIAPTVARIFEEMLRDGTVARIRAQVIGSYPVAPLLG
jgi:ABC-type amino acid transport substrate-binding protein